MLRGIVPGYSEAERVNFGGRQSFSLPNLGNVRSAVTQGLRPRTVTRGLSWLVSSGSSGAR